MLFVSEINLQIYEFFDESRKYSAKFLNFTYDFASPTTLIHRRRAVYHIKWFTSPITANSTSTAPIILQYLRLVAFFLPLKNVGATNQQNNPIIVIISIDDISLSILRQFDTFRLKVSPFNRPQSYEFFRYSCPSKYVKICTALLNLLILHQVLIL